MDLGLMPPLVLDARGGSVLGMRLPSGPSGGDSASPVARGLAVSLSESRAAMGGLRSPVALASSGSSGTPVVMTRLGRWLEPSLAALPWRKREELGEGLWGR